VSATVDAIFAHNLEPKDQDMRGLYEKAKRDQWNASSDIDWKQEVNPDGGIFPDGLIDIYGTKYWEKMSPRERTELNRHFSAWRISQLMYGEEFAMLICSQLVNVVPDIDGKFFIATQVVDEARHSEVLTRYLLDKVGVTYPLTSSLRNLFDQLLQLPQWYFKTVGTQLVAETLAVSLFRMLEQHSQDPLVSSICKRILADESRHMGFGMLSLPGQIKELSAQEVRVPLGETRPIARFVHVAAAPRCAVQEVDPRFSRAGYPAPNPLERGGLESNPKQGGLLLKLPCFQGGHKRARPQFEGDPTGKSVGSLL
jgi:hypothetical protein